MPLPNFLICGAQRSGTTSLYHYLAQHPDVFLSPKKEIHYFSKNYARGEAWYEQHFINGESFKAIGEASPTYMDSQEAPARMAQLIPETKLCFLLRNPIHRAYSAYWFNISFGQNPDQTFSEVIRSDEGYYRYIWRGFYKQHIDNYLKYYDRDLLHILFTEELKASPLEQVRSCFSFINVDQSFIPKVQEKFNVSQPATNPASVFLHRKWRRIKIVLLKSQLVSPSFRRQTVKFRTLLGGLLNSTNKAAKPKMLPEDHNYLAKIYRQHNEQLSEFLNRELPW